MYTYILRALGHFMYVYGTSWAEIPHFKKNKAVGVMKPGHCFTVEPMLNLGTARERMWPDGWTAATRDGRRSAQFEHTFLVTEDGLEVLTARGSERRGDGHYHSYPCRSHHQINHIPPLSMYKPASNKL